MSASEPKPVPKKRFRYNPGSTVSEPRTAALGLHAAEAGQEPKSKARVVRPVYSAGSAKQIQELDMSDLVDSVVPAEASGQEVGSPEPPATVESPSGQTVPSAGKVNLACHSQLNWAHQLLNCLEYVQLCACRPRMVVLLSEPYPTDNEAMAVCCRKPKLSLSIMANSLLSCINGPCPREPALVGPDLKDPSVWCQLATKGLLCVNRVPVSPRDAADKAQAKLAVAESWVPLIVDLCSRARVVVYVGSGRPAGYETVLRMDNCHRCRQPVYYGQSWSWPTAAVLMWKEVLSEP